MTHILPLSMLPEFLSIVRVLLGAVLQHDEQLFSCSRRKERIVLTIPRRLWSECIPKEQTVSKEGSSSCNGVPGSNSES